MMYTGGQSDVQQTVTSTATFQDNQIVVGPVDCTIQPRLSSAKMSEETICENAFGTLLSSPGAANSSAKRKSFEEANDENVHVNRISSGSDDSNTSKKTRFRESTTASGSSSSAPAPAEEKAILTEGKVKSALPRFQVQVKQAPGSKRESLRSGTTTPKKEASGRNAATPAKYGTPGQVHDTISKFEDMVTPNANANTLLRRLKKSMQRNPTGDVIETFFATPFSINDEKVAQIMANLKMKNKLDYKEKIKKQEGVIKELKGCIQTMFVEVKALKDNCVGQEAFTAALLRDSYEEFLENSQNMNALKSYESKQRKEIARLQEDLSTTTSAFTRYKAESAPLLAQAKEFDANLALVTAELRDERVRNAELLNMQKMITDARNKAEDEVRAQKLEADKNVAMSVAGYKDELSSLKYDLQRKQGDLDRYIEEKAVLDQKKGQTSEELILTQSKLRESENNAKRTEQEASRLAADIQYMKEQLAQKDADLRSTINSLNDLQRQSFEDKGSLRTELASQQGRVQFLEEDRLNLTAQLAAKKEECASQARDIAQLRENIAALEGKLSIKELEATAAKESFIQLEIEKELRARCEIREEAERRERIAAVGQLVAIQMDCANQVREIEEKMHSTIDGFKAEVAVATHKHQEAVEEQRKQSDVIMSLENQLQQQHLALQNASANHESVEKLGVVTGELEITRRRLRELMEHNESQHTVDAAKFAELEEKLRAGEVQRRKLHNLVQELRGNIRVFARVRPFLPSDGVDLSKTLPDSSIAVRGDVNSLKIARPDGNEEHNFAFDRVFGPAVSQETLFQEVSEFVQSALDGYNVCLFSYGQTGSGKTHTMQGSGTGSMRGVIPRAMQQVGLYKNELEAKGWEYTMHISFVEIYNEIIRDLLRKETQDDLKHDIKKDANGDVYVSDIEMINVNPNNVEQIEQIMELAARHRSVGQTAMNERSSRSHSVFTLHLRAANKAQNIVLKGTLNLVDLAGSERLDRSNASGAQMKETCAINKSLSALTDVFVAIASKQAHIPFRNSKLTYLLQPAFAGDGKTLMMVNLSPTEESYYESLSSLRLAKQVNQCELGKPKKQLRDAKEAPPASVSSSTPAPVPALSATTPSKTPQQLSLSLPPQSLSAALNAAAGTPSNVSLSASLGSKRVPTASSSGVSSSVQGNAAKRANTVKK